LVLIEVLIVVQFAEVERVRRSTPG